MLFDIIGKVSGSNGLSSQSVTSADMPTPSTASERETTVAPAAGPVRILPKAPPASGTDRIGTLDSGVEIKGTLKSSNDLYFDGRIEGEIHCAGTLTVGTNACVKGTMNSRRVVILGQVEGNIAVQERCELTHTANVLGDITAGSLSVEEGASFMGQSRSGKQHAAAKPAQSAPLLPVPGISPVSVSRLAA